MSVVESVLLQHENSFIVIMPTEYLVLGMPMTFEHSLA